MKTHIVLVCGGRSYSNNRVVKQMLDALSPRPTMIIHGGAGGADALGWWWAEKAGVSHRAFYADWKFYGKAAGPIRNQQMLDEGKPDLVVAFPGGKGTADMVRRANAAGVPVMEIL